MARRQDLHIVASRAITSHAISIATGPGRPDSICRNASSTMAGASATRSIRSAHLQTRAQRRALVRQFVQMAAPLADEGGRHLPRHAKTGAQQPAAVASAANVFSTPGPGTTEKTPGRPGRARMAEGHIGAGLFVPRADSADRPGMAMQRVEERIHLRARQAEDGFDAIGDQRADDRLATCHRDGIAGSSGFSGHRASGSNSGSATLRRP